MLIKVTIEIDKRNNQETFINWDTSLVEGDGFRQREYMSTRKDSIEALEMILKFTKLPPHLAKKMIEELVCFTHTPVSGDRIYPVEVRDE